MYELGGTTARQELNNVDVQLKSFPYPPYHDDRFIIVLQTQMPFLIMLSFIVTAPVICRDVVLEKEKKLKVETFLLVYFRDSASVSYSVIQRCVTLNDLEWLFRVKFCFRTGLAG